MSADGIQGIHDGGGQVCRYPEPRETDGVSLAGPVKEEVPVVVAPLDQAVFVEGANLFHSKFCGRESYNPKTHYCMDGAVMKYPDPKALAELKRQQQETRQRELAWRKSLPAGAVICGANESLEDCSKRASARPGADNFTDEDLPGWARVVVDVGKPVAVVAGGTAAILTAPVSAIVIGGGALVAACSTQEEPPATIPPLPEPTPEQTGDAYANVPETQVNELEKDLKCLPPSYSFELVLEAEGLPKVENGQVVAGDPVNGCSRLTLGLQADPKKVGKTIILTGYADWNSKPAEKVMGPDAKALLCREDGSALATCNPNYQKTYPAFADVKGFTAVARAELVTEPQCSMDLSLVSTSLEEINGEVSAPPDLGDLYLVTAYSGAAPDCLADVKFLTERIVPLAGALKVGLVWDKINWVEGEEGTERKVTVTLCDNNDSKLGKPCETKDGLGSLSKLTVTLLIKKLADQGTTPFTEVDAGESSAGPDASGGADAVDTSDTPDAGASGDASDDAHILELIPPDGYPSADY